MRHTRRFVAVGACVGLLAAAGALPASASAGQASGASAGQGAPGTHTAPAALLRPQEALAAPTEVVAVAGDRRAVVTWQSGEAAERLADLTFTVRSSPGGRECVAQGRLRCTVTGLRNGQAYVFTVKASDGTAESAWSAASNAVTPLAPPTAKPRAVRGLAATTVGVVTTFTWLAPRPADQVLRYQWRVTPAGERDFTRWDTLGDPTTVSFAVENFDTGFRWTVQLRAVNALGAGKIASVTYVS